MYTTTVTLDTGVIDALREVTPRVPQIASAYFARTVQPAIAAEVRVTIAQYPGPVVHPFAFSTPKSRRAFFATNGFGRGLGAPRTNNLANSWTVRIDRRSRDEFLRIVNTASYAGYVYGPGNPLATFRQVPGHRVTGWGANLPSQLDHLTDFSIEQLLTAWNVVMEAILSGKMK